MRSPTRPFLFGACAAALLLAVGGGVWLGWGTADGSPAAPPPEPMPVSAPAPIQAPASTAQFASNDALPLPPPPVRLSDDPEYDRCLAMLANDPQGAFAMSEAWAGGGEPARHCGALALLALGEAERAAPRLEEVGRRSQAGAFARAAVFGQAAQAWMIAGAPQRAYGAVTIALSLSPDDADLLLDRAVASGVLGRHMEAIADLNQALSMDADRVDALVLRAAEWRQMDRIDNAQADIARALSLDADNAEALLERGILRQVRGDLGGAQADWERVIELGPDTPTADLAAQNLLLIQAGPRRN
ncbi:tetratricopeptide repeat protein [Humitalea sp. 24SJ18S-53]|uniref:tetratricopeptide repeat protein n=1 Tax=Humitalea sp. 24SJ18S-53 TaxID=3422307 RepID=UPI003D665E4C